MKKDKKDRTQDNEVYQRLKRVHYGMIQRCTNPNNSSYYNYGAKGVTISDKWLDFEGFLEDIDSLPGWDEDRYVPDKLALDKDIFWGNKVYSKETCRFVTPEENNTMKPNQQHKLVGYSPEKKLYRFHSANGFAKEHNIGTNGIFTCARGETLQHWGWQFCFEEDYYEGIFLEPYSWIRTLVGMSPKGGIYEFKNASQFAREHNLIEATVIIACAKGKNKHTRLWQFRYKDEVEAKPFEDPKSLKPASKRGQKIRAISPEGNIYITTNQTKFAKEHNINRLALRKVMDGEREHYKGWKFERI